MQHVFECPEQQVDSLWRCIVPHQPDAPRLALQRSEPAGDLDTAFEQLAAHQGVVHAGRDLDDIELRQALRRGREQLEPQPLEALREALVGFAMAAPAGFEPFFYYQAQRFTEGVQARDRRGMMEDAVFGPPR